MTRFTPQEQALMAGNSRDSRDILDVRAYRYLKANPDWNDRDRIMHWCKFPDPAHEPVLAYVAFANCVIRLNARLKRFGLRIDRSEGKSEQYRLLEVIDA